MSSRKHSTVQTTKDKVSIFTIQIAMSGVGAAPSGTIVSCTDERMVTGSTNTHPINYLSGTQNADKVFKVTFPTDNQYNQIIGLNSSHTAYLGAPAYGLRIYSASIEGFKFAFTTGSAGGVPATVAPVIADGVTGSFNFIVRNTDRRA